MAPIGELNTWTVRLDVMSLSDKPRAVKIDSVQNSQQFQ